jgi:hypothetical protein
MNRTSFTAQGRRTAFGEFTVTVPYNRSPVQAKAFIEALKDAVPSRYRTYDPALKEWRVWGEFKDLAITLLLKYFPDADVPRQTHSKAQAQPRQAGSDHFQVLHLLPTAPPELIDAAFRCLAKIHHPDRGGDSAVMRQLTEAHEALSRSLSA